MELPFETCETGIRNSSRIVILYQGRQVQFGVAGVGVSRSHRYLSWRKGGRQENCGDGNLAPATKHLRAEGIPWSHQILQKIRARIWVACLPTY